MKKKMKLSYYKLITENHQAIRELRLEKGWTLAEAARLLGLKSKGLGHLENGRVGLSKVDCFNQAVGDFSFLMYTDVALIRPILDHFLGSRCHI